MSKMSRLTTVILLIFSLVITVFTRKATAEPVYYRFEVNSSVSVPEIDMKPVHTYVLDCKWGDVNGDNITDAVVLAGYKPGGVSEAYSEEIYLFIQDGKTKKFIRVSPGEVNAGYNPKLFLGDFDGDKVSEIFVSIGNGGDAGTSTYRLISFKEGKATPLFNEKEFSAGLKLEVEFKDDFKAITTLEGMESPYIIDIRAKKNDYINQGIYNAEGKLLKQTTAVTTPFSDIKPEDVDRDGIFELRGVQKIKIADKSDTVALAETLWKFTCCSKDSLKEVRIVPAED
jgi:hypothetical protein